jgi:hypothetical protein
MAASTIRTSTGISVEMSAATGRCAGCGNTGPLAEDRTFCHSPGLVLRCPACGEALLRLTCAPGHAWLDVRGLEYIELAAPEQALARFSSAGRTGPWQLGRLPPIDDVR